MALQTICDKCGEVMKTDGRIVRVAIQVGNEVWSIDACKTCVAPFVKLMPEDPEIIGRAARHSAAEALSTVYK